MQSLREAGCGDLLRQRLETLWELIIDIDENRHKYTVGQSSLRPQILHIQNLYHSSY
jgi:hypothetical protein